MKEEKEEPRFSITTSNNIFILILCMCVELELASSSAFIEKGEESELQRVRMGLTMDGEEKAVWERRIG